MNTEILEKYRKMQVKFDLPQLVELKEAFKFELNDDIEMFDQIRNEISDKLFTFTERIIEHMISGSESFCCLFEQDMINNAERKRLFELYKKIQVLKWENNMLIMKPNDKKTAEWIKKTWDLWNSELEDKLTILCKKFSTSWENLEFKSDKTNYHG